MNYELVHANLGLAKYPINDERMGSFWARNDPIYDQANKVTGFIRAVDFPDRFCEFPEPHILNASIWSNISDLRSFVYAGLHADAMKNKREWFQDHELPNYVLFWTQAGIDPNEKEIAKRIYLLKEIGASKEAFTFKQAFEKNA